MPKDLNRSSLFIGFLDIALIALLILEFGFTALSGFKIYKLIALPSILVGLIAFNLYKYKKFSYNKPVQKRALTSLVILLLLIGIEVVFIFLKYNGSVISTFFIHREVLEYGLLFYFFIRLTFLMRTIYGLFFNPAILFVGSFLIVILTGTLLLLLPSSTTQPISFTDSLFTATSAVCVTGLVVVDVGKEFTLFGQAIIMVLIQLGGLGLLTFTTFFAYFFKSGSSFRESLYMQDMLKHDELSDMRQVTIRIVLFSFFVEAIGAIFIYDAVKNLNLESHAFFAAFHAISAYCNGGFSTISGNLGAPGLRFNYYLQWVIMILIIFGGIGYFISFNFLKYIKQFLINLFNKKKKKSIVRIITLNTKIVVYTTLILIFGGTIAFLFTEYHTVLSADKTFFGKWTTSMFSAVTARTCGFNTVDCSRFTVPGLLIMILLMWVGASPASTGGGIKTSSFALATLNVFSTARNKTYIEIGTRRVATEAVRRAFAIIILSLIANSIGILLVSIFDPEFSLMEVAFENFSAFSTVGLSMGITSDLSTLSKYVIIFMMFFGRIGLINLMTGILRSLKTQSYEYPRENILIN